MTGTDVARFTHKQSRSYLNHLVIQMFKTANSKMCHWVPVYRVYICFILLCVLLLISEVTKKNMEISATNFKSRLLDFSV